MASPPPPRPPLPPAAPSPSPWDAHAAVYEQVWERSTSLWGYDALVLGQLPAPSPSSSPMLLDVACGSGSLALAAAARGFSVTATDLSPGMIARLQNKLSASSLAHKITPRVVDGQTLDGLDDASFDVVSSVFGIFLFPDRVAAWRSALRVLVPGGRLLAVSWDANSVNVRMVRYLMENAQDKVSSATTATDTPLQNVLVPAVNRTVFAASFREELEECGFREVTIHTTTHAMCFQSGEELVLGVLDNSAFVAMTGHKTSASLQRCILDYAQLVLDGEDPFAVDASAKAVAFCDDGGDVATHPLWRKAFALPNAIGHIAVASKP